MNLTQPMLLRKMSAIENGVLIMATPLRFIPIHSSAPPSPGERMEAEARPGASAKPSVPA